MLLLPYSPLPLPFQVRIQQVLPSEVHSPHAPSLLEFGEEFEDFRSDAMGGDPIRPSAISETHDLNHRAGQENQRCEILLCSKCLKL